MFRLLDMLFPPREDEKIVRTVSDNDFLSLMTPQLVPATRPSTTVLLPFSHPSVRGAIHEAKYHGSSRAFRLLGCALAEYLRNASDEVMKPIIIIPIPLGEKRCKERGFNQIEEIAKVMAKELSIKIDATLLRRTRETVSQVSLPRHKREENMRGAFDTAHPVDASCTYIVIDDVLTTGATLQAAVDALREAGAEEIVPLALAH